MKQATVDQIEKINKLVDYICDEYVKAGGKKEDANKEFTFFALLGITEREGEKALDDFIYNWRPHISKPRTIGYAGI
jgi:hypothetical protein